MYGVLPSPAGVPADETTFELDTGKLATVKITPVWNSNGAGVTFTGVARYIDITGVGITDANGNQVKTTFTETVSADRVVSAGMSAIYKEITNALLGDALDATLQSMLDFSATAVTLANLQSAITAYTATATVNSPSSVLGL